MKILNRQHGSILIEALIALVVLGLGIAAIAKLQGTFIKEGAEAEARNVALQLAQQRIDDLRAYNQLDWPVSTNGKPPILRPYSDIQDNLGGSINWTATATQVGNTSYGISWNIVNYKIPITGIPPAPIVAGTPTMIDDDNIDDSAYKQITVTVSWTPPCDTTVTDPCPSENVNLTTYLAKLDQYGEALLGGGGFNSAGPIVKYNPGAAPEVISIDTSGESIETTLPEPAIKTIAGVDYFYSQFETVTYSTGGDALRDEEFLNINCKCEYDNSDYINLGYPPARSIWHPKHDGTADDQALHDEYVDDFFHPGIGDHAFISQSESGRADFLGEQITKVIGKSSGTASSQHPFCDICCRDHHDAKAGHILANNSNNTALAGAYACDPDTDFASAGDADGDRARCFDPWRPDADYDSSTGDHKHYTKDAVAVAPGGAGIYLESCRLKRINGNFNVFQDWHLHGSTFVAAPQKVFTPGATGNVVTAYRAYIKDYVSAVIEDAVNMPVTTLSNPASAFVWPENSATYPVSTHFISRGIYMDYLDSFTLTQLNDVRVNDPDNFFENAPFNEINLTRLSNWQPECVNGSPPNQGAVASTYSGHRNVSGSPVPGSCVTNFGILAAFTSANINRGLITVTSASDAFNLTTSILLSNTGLTGTNTYLKESSTSQPYPSSSDDRYYDIGLVTNNTLTNGTPPTPPTTFAITSASGTNNYSVTSFTCNSGSCTGLSAGTYTVSATLFKPNPGGDTQTCSKSYTITTADINVTVSKGTGGATPPCVMAP